MWLFPLGNLARVLASPPTGSAEAEQLLRRALAIDEKSLGPNHPHVAMDLNNLAMVVLYPPDAEPLFSASPCN